jgi:hypothetical protein
MDRDTMGIYVPSNKTFYYLEAGGALIGNTIDRIKKTLVQRNVITVSIDGSPSDYRMMSKREFLSKHPDYHMKPIYISKHVENMLTQGNKNNEQSTGLFKD